MGKGEHSHSSKSEEFSWTSAPLWQRISFILLPLLLITAAMWWGAEIRNGQSDLSGLRDRISENVYSQIAQGISQQVDQQFPFATPAYKQKTVEAELAKVRKTGILEQGGQSINVENYIDSQTAMLKANFQTPDGQTYYGSIDPYYYLALADNVVTTGTTGNTFITDTDGTQKPWLTRMLAPIGIPGLAHPELHVWLMAKIYELNHVTENSPVSEKFRVTFFLPVLVAILAVIPTYFIVRRFSSDIIAFFASLVCVSGAIFVSRTVAGSVDNDPYNVVLPLFVAAAFVWAVSAKRWWVAVILAVLAGFFQGLFMWAWGPAWFIFLFVTMASIGYLVYLLGVWLWEHYITKRHEHTSIILVHVKQQLITLVSFWISSYIFTKLLYNSSVNIFTHTINGIFGSIADIASFNAANIWPNVLSSVAELNPAGFTDIVSSIGGSFIFVLAMIGLVSLGTSGTDRYDFMKWVRPMLYLIASVWFISIAFGGAFVTLTSNHKLLFLILLFLPVGVSILLGAINGKTSVKVALCILLSVWMAGTIYMSFSGVRFIMLLGPAFAIAFAFSLDAIARGINNFALGELELKGLMKYAPGLFLASVLFLFMFVPIARGSASIDDQQSILFDKAWFDAGVAVDANSAPDAIVTSWWDFGHFFHAIWKRSVTFDGASQTHPSSHWVGKLLLESDERTSGDILRMLVCGGNTAFETMNNYSKDPTGGVLVVKQLYASFGLTNEQKREMLADNIYYNYSSAQIDTIMTKLACEKPLDSIFVTSGDMVGKAGVWAHWGTWNFSKKFVYDSYETKSANEIAALLKEDPIEVQKMIDEIRQIDIQAKTQNIKRTDLINRWFADYPSIITNADCQQLNETIVCPYNLVVGRDERPEPMDTVLTRGVINTSRPSSSYFEIQTVARQTGRLLNTAQIRVDEIDFAATDGFKSFKFENASLPYQVMMYTVNGAPHSILVGKPLAKSMFVQLFYMEGGYTKTFERIYDGRSLTAGRILVWKKNWSATPAISTPTIEIPVANNQTLAPVALSVNDSAVIS
ncbi:MAG TPA: STT3 domain-containing protein [Acidobacteriota bacterium]|nr:STT3 domain-containing protein [Acidobacteriota bacterium]